MKISLRLFIYFSIFLHLLGGALYYYYKNPGISLFNKERPVSIPPAVKDSTAKKFVSDSSSPKYAEPLLQKIPIKKPSPLPQTKMEPAAIKNPLKYAMIEWETDSNSEESEAAAKQLLKKNKNVKFFFGSDTVTSPIKKPETEISSLSGGAGPKDSSSTMDEIEVSSLSEKQAGLKDLSSTMNEIGVSSLSGGEAGPKDLSSTMNEIEVSKLPGGEESLTDSSLVMDETGVSSLSEGEAGLKDDKTPPPPIHADSLPEKPPSLEIKEEAGPEWNKNLPNQEGMDLEKLSIPAQSSAEEADTEKIKAKISFKSFLNVKQREGNPNLNYPKKARQIKAQGSLSLIFYLTSDGLVDKIQIESSSGHSELDNSVMQTFARYKFLPNQEGWVRHKVDFKLKGEEVEFLRLREK